jgi:hypothetical protein
MSSLSSSKSFPVVSPASLMGFLFLLLQCLAIGCTESSTQRAQRLEPMLMEAGFREVPANTPARAEKLSQMTPLKVSYFARHGKSSYWFADPYVCHCLYVGSEHNYQQLQQLKQERAEEVTQENDQRNFEQFMASPAGQVFYGE